MTEIVLRGSMKVWDSEQSYKNSFKTYKIGDIFMTKPDVSSDFLNARKFLITYEANSETLEYTRSWVPLWFFTSFSSNLSGLELSSAKSLLLALFDCLSTEVVKRIGRVYLYSQKIFEKLFDIVEPFVQNFMDRYHDCCF